MIVYIGMKDCEVVTGCMTSLKGVCEQLGVNYISAIRGKREWRGDSKKVILEMEVERVKGRGNTNNFKHEGTA